ncbi:MAG: hypothetical protein ACLP1X_20645 [Polyangiaceae bacterium]
MTLAPLPPALTTLPPSMAVPVATAAPQPALPPTAEPDSQPQPQSQPPPPRRMGPAAVSPATPVRGTAATSTTEAIPPATVSTVNSFVQAVHDDIAEDEASHKKR